MRYTKAYKLMGNVFDRLGIPNHYDVFGVPHPEIITPDLLETLERLEEEREIRVNNFRKFVFPDTGKAVIDYDLKRWLAPHLADVIIIRDEGYNPRFEEPRIGYMITGNKLWKSVDQHEELHDLFLQAYNSGVVSPQDHMRKFRELAEEAGYRLLAVFPISKHDHSFVQYELGILSDWDVGFNGVYVITEDSFENWKKETGKHTEPDEDELMKVVKEEIKRYNAYLLGDIYRVLVERKKDGKVVESEGGFYDEKQIREWLAREVHPEWKTYKPLIYEE